MKIRVKSEDRNFTILLPTNLIFSRGTVWLANHVGRKHAGDAMKDISPQALEKLFSEFRRIKKRHGTWELVDVCSADGERVQVIL